MWEVAEDKANKARMAETERKRVEKREKTKRMKGEV